MALGLSIGPGPADGVRRQEKLLRHWGQSEYYVRDDNVWTVTLEDGRESSLTDLVGRPGRLGPHLATDGDYLYFTWAEALGDIWVLDVVYGEEE